MKKKSLEEVRILAEQLKDHYVYNNKKTPEEKKVETARDNEMDDVINRLESNDSSLIELRIVNKNIEPENLIRLASSLPGNTVLTTLFLTNVPLSSDRVSILAEGIKENSSLRELCFINNGIDCHGASTLADVIRNKNNSQSSGIESLTIKLNNVKDNGAIAIAEALGESKTLTYLDLMVNQIGDSGAEHLARAIEINTTLQILSLSNNLINDRGGICIAKSLEKNSTLQKIYFNFADDANGDIFAREFISVLETNGSLRLLSINPKFISENLILKIKKIAARNESFCKHYEKELPKRVNDTLGFFHVPKCLSDIVTEYCKGEYPRYSAK